MVSGPRWSFRTRDRRILRGEGALRASRSHVSPPFGRGAYSAADVASAPVRPRRRCGGGAAAQARRASLYIATKFSCIERWVDEGTTLVVLNGDAASKQCRRNRELFPAVKPDEQSARVPEKLLIQRVDVRSGAGTHLRGEDLTARLVDSQPPADTAGGEVRGHQCRVPRFT